MASTKPPIQVSAAVVDLSQRFRGTTAIVGSPATSEEAIVASLTLTDALQVISNIKLFGWVAATVGTNGVSVQLRVRQTDVNGAVVGDSGATSQTAAKLITVNVAAVDASPTLPGQVYVLTAQVASGSAISTVSAVNLRAEII
jgi:hypothetical protein